MSRRSRVAMATAGLVVLAGATAGPALADHQVQHFEVTVPAVDKFAEDVPELLDDEWGVPIGGFGGISRGAPLTHAPVIFVHGNVVDHGDWYPVRDDFLAAGWTMQELWALSYNGMGNGSGSSPARSNPERDEDHAGHDNLPRGTNNDLNVPDLERFIRMVQDYTGQSKFHLVGHSLGVTVARKTMFVHPDLAADVVSLVGIAGANDGTSLCAPFVSRGTHMSCDEIDQGTPWLEELNGPGGELETYGPTRWLTVYDGSGGGDVAFVGPTYAQSPALEGAENVEYSGVDHNGLRMREDIVAFYREWIEQAEVEAGIVESVPAPDVAEPVASGTLTPSIAADPVIPATGIPAVLLGLLGVGSTSIGVRLVRGRHDRR